MSASAAFVVAHRGASYEANENAASAIRRAAELGVESIEIDVHATKDGAVVVHHDEDLLRACGDPRLLRDLTRVELAKLRQSFSAADGRKRDAEPILFLEDAMALASPLPLVVEIKSGARDPSALTRAVVAKLRRDDTGHRIISFEIEVVRQACTNFDPSRVGLIRNTEYGEDGWRELLTPSCGIAVASRRIATPDRLASILAAGRVAYVYALDDATSVEHFARLGATGIVSNRPDLALATLRAMLG